MLAPVFALATEGQRNRGARREGTPADWTASGWPSRGVVRPTLSTPPARLLLWVPRPIATTRCGAVALVGLLAPSHQGPLLRAARSPRPPWRAGPQRAQRSAWVPSLGGSSCALSAPPPARALTARLVAVPRVLSASLEQPGVSRARPRGCVSPAFAPCSLWLCTHRSGARPRCARALCCYQLGGRSAEEFLRLARPTECIGGKKVAHSQSLLGGRRALKFPGASLGCPSATACPRVRYPPWPPLADFTTSTQYGSPVTQSLSLGWVGSISP